MGDVELIYEAQLELILSICGFLLCFYFLKKFMKVRKTSRELLPFLGVALAFLAWGVSYLLSSQRIFLSIFEIEFLAGEFFPKFEFVLLFSSVVFVAFLCELSLRKTKFITTCTGVAVVIIGMFMETGVVGVGDDLATYQLIGGPIILLPLIPLLYFAFIKPTFGSLRHRMYFAMFGFFLAASGLVFRNRAFNSLFFGYNGIFARIFAIMGLISIGYGFAAYSTFTDLQWKDKMREIFVISPNGVCIYAFSFEQQIPLEDSDLIAGGFSGIQLLLSEMVKTTESLHLIDYQSVKIMVEQGASAMFVLILKEESSFLEYKLRSFAEEFQNFFKEVLQHWIGEMEVFKPTRTLIQRVFEQN